MKVSVLIITYNHEKFIAPAIDSVLMQQVNFDYEIVIGEDCSTDNTRDIVIDYQKRNPEKIRLILPERNLGMMQNYLQTLEACRGEYIASLEGDDYWTSPFKLQKQVEFLDNNLDYALCFHPVEIISEDNLPIPGRIWGAPVKRDTFSLEDLFIYDNFIPTCSVVLRREVFSSVPGWFKIVPHGDWVSHIFTARCGKIRCIDELMGVYRVHSGGVWTGWSELDKQKKRIENYKIVGKHLGLRKKPYFRKALSTHLLLLARKYEAVGHLFHARRAALEAFFYSPYEGQAGALKTLLRLTAPRLIKLLKFARQKLVSGPDKASSRQKRQVR